MASKDNVPSFTMDEVYWCDVCRDMHAVVARTTLLCDPATVLSRTLSKGVNDSTSLSRVDAEDEG
jgi:hypothetical protein